MNAAEIEARQKHFTDSFEARLRAEKIGKQDNPPTLYHYTTAEGVVGIIAKNEIWATNYRYVNDQTEFLYANELLDEEIARRLHRRSASPLEGVILDAISNTPDRLLGSLNIFIACFCEDGDLLSQWRGYGGHGGGFAIGFNGYTTSVTKAGYSSELYQVNYERSKQQKLIRALLNEFFAVVEHLNKNGAIPSASPGRGYFRGRPVIRSEVTPGTGLILVSDLPEPLDKLIIRLTFAFFELACCFKNPKFKIEQEWRLVHKSWSEPSATHPTVSCRVAGTSIIPYVKLPLYMTNHPNSSHLKGGNCSLERIIFGPGMNPLVTKSSLQYLTAGFSTPIDISQSEIKVKV